MRLVLSLFIVLLLSAAAGCKSRPTEKARQGTLAERVEGSEGLERLVAAVTEAVPKNDTVAKKFAATNWDEFKPRMVSYLCRSVGGKCDFAGTQRDALGVELSDDEFTAFMEIVIVAMNEVDLPQKEQNDLIDVMMRDREAAAKAPSPGAAPAPAPAAPAAVPSAAPAPPAVQ